MTDAELGEKCLGALHDIAETECKFFKKHFDILFLMIFNFYQNKSVSYQIKEQGLELIFTIIQNMPSIIKKNKQQIEQIINMIFINMINIEDQIDKDWMRPPEGFNDYLDEDDNFSKTRDGMNNINKIIDAIGKAQILPILSSYIMQMLQQEDWRYIFSAFMALSQMGEFLDNINEVEPVLKTLERFVTHTNSKVRYSICHALGLIADEMKVGAPCAPGPRTSPSQTRCHALFPPRRQCFPGRCGPLGSWVPGFLDWCVR